MKHFRSIDGLRGMMAWWVVCQHVLQLSGYSDKYPSALMTLATSGGVAVMVFIIVSGYVVTHLLLSKAEPYPAYITRRFFRIYPLFILSLLVALALRDLYFEVIVNRPWAADAVRLSRFESENSNLALHLIAHFTVLHGAIPSTILPYASTAILPPAWSLSLEWQFYLVAPFLVSIIANRQGRLNALLTVAAIAYFIVSIYRGNAAWDEPSFLLTAIGYFLVGIGTRLLFERVSWLYLAGPICVIIANVLYTTRFFTSGNIEFAILPLAIWGIAIIAMLHEGKSSGTLPQRMLRFAFANDVLVNLGKWSYSTYLLHIPVFVVALWIARRLGIDASNTSYLAVMLLSTVAVVLVSQLSYRYVELPGMRLSRTLLARV